MCLAVAMVSWGCLGDGGILSLYARVIQGPLKLQQTTAQNVALEDQLDCNIVSGLVIAAQLTYEKGSSQATRHMNTCYTNKTLLIRSTSGIHQCQ